MLFTDVLKENGGSLYYSKDVGYLPVKNTMYGAVIERFEGDKYDIQLTVEGLENLDKVLGMLNDNSNKY